MNPPRKLHPSCTFALLASLALLNARCETKCAPPLQKCGESCVNTYSDSTHCGPQCLQCPAEYACRAGACVRECPDATTCGDACQSTRSDPLHCGGCDNRCADARGARANVNSACDAGVCQYPCQEGYGDCDGDPSNGCETTTGTSTTHCGVCGRRCVTPNGTPACVGGRCTLESCEVGHQNCDGQIDNGCEVDLAGDNQNCGRCGYLCDTASAGFGGCADGGCQLTCMPGRASCPADGGTSCINVTNDPLNCGGCGNACGPNRACVGGGCM